MLIDGQGNFGSVDGDSPAAMRHTEVRMSKIAHELLADIDKETVNFVANYDESESEPTVMPTRIPTLLINGSSGIAVGMATNIPPHNLVEIVTACLALIENPDLSIQELMQIVPMAHQGFTKLMPPVVVVFTCVLVAILKRLAKLADKRLLPPSYLIKLIKPVYWKKLPN
jgi:hypothetical protein